MTTKDILNSWYKDILGFSIGCVLLSLFAGGNRLLDYFMGLFFGSLVVTLNIITTNKH